MEFMHRLCLGVVLLICFTPFVRTWGLDLKPLQTPKTDCEGAVEIQAATALAGGRFLGLVVQLRGPRPRATRLRLRLQTPEGFVHSETIECAQICIEAMTPPHPPRPGHSLQVWVDDISGIFPGFTPCSWEPYSVEVEGLAPEALDMTLNETLDQLRMLSQTVIQTVSRSTLYLDSINTEIYRCAIILLVVSSFWLVFLLLNNIKPLLKCCKRIKSRPNGSAGNNHSNGSIVGSSAAKQCRVQVVLPLPVPKDPTAPPVTPTADRWHSLSASIPLPAAAPLSYA